MDRQFKNLEKKKIMLVEDDKFLSDIINRKFSSIKCIFIHVEDGAKAVEIIDKEKPDLIILDILLPGKNGFEILEDLKNDKDLKNIPVMILSNLGQKEEIQKGMALGALLFLVKSNVTPSDILELVNEELGKFYK